MRFKEYVCKRYFIDTHDVKQKFTFVWKITSKSVTFNFYPILKLKELFKLVLFRA